MGERFARFDFAGESEKDRPHRVVEPAVGDDHVEDRLRLLGHALPNTERFQQPACGGNDRRGALVVGVASAQRRVGDGDRERRPEPLPQRDREREAGKAAARDQHVAMVVRERHG